MNMLKKVWRSLSPCPEKEAIDFVVPFHGKDSTTLSLVVQGIRGIRACRNIYIISEENPKLEFSCHVAERAFDRLMTKESIEDRWRRHHPPLAWRTGWLYQQFLKLLCPAIIPGLSEAFVVVDADTIFLRDVAFHLEKYYFCKAKEYHGPYLGPIQKLLGVKQTIGFSCICHHAIFHQRHLGEMIRSIEARHGRSLVEVVLSSVDYREPSCFSEWDLYANYMILNHPELCKRRQLKWSDLKEIPMSERLSRLAKKYDFVSCHAYLRTA